MSMLGISIAPLSPSVVSDHFSNAQLQELYRLFCLGNILPDPSNIAGLAEKVYAFPSREVLARPRHAENDRRRSGNVHFPGPGDEGAGGLCEEMIGGRAGLGRARVQNSGRGR